MISSSKDNDFQGKCTESIPSVPGLHILKLSVFPAGPLLVTCCKLKVLVIIDTGVYSKRETSQRHPGRMRELDQHPDGVSIFFQYTSHTEEKTLSLLGPPTWMTWPLRLGCFCFQDELRDLDDGVEPFSVRT